MFFFVSIKLYYMTMIYPEPSYLSGLVTRVNNETLIKIQKNYGINTTAFKFNNKFTGLIQTWLDKFDTYGGTVWGIDTTGNKILLFDQFRHGYDALMGLNEQENLDSTKFIDLPQPMEIIMAFQYNGEEEEYLEDGSSKFKQDYFGWVVIYKMLDGKIQEFLSYECA
jgi:hypothetical protein